MPRRKCPPRCRRRSKRFGVFSRTRPCRRNRSPLQDPRTSEPSFAFSVRSANSPATGWRRPSSACTVRALGRVPWTPDELRCLCWKTLKTAHRIPWPNGCPSWVTDKGRMNLVTPEPATPVRAGSRRLLAIVVVIVVILLVGGAAAYVVLTAPQPARVLVVGTTDDEITFDPADAYDYFSGNIIQNTMAMLLTYDPPTTNLTPDLLSAVPTLANGGISLDGEDYHLHLRANLKFEYGAAINSPVLKYS